MSKHVWPPLIVSAPDANARAILRAAQAALNEAERVLAAPGQAGAAAMSACDRARDQLHGAVREVLLAEVAPIIHWAYQAKVALASQMPPIMALFRALRTAPSTAQTVAGGWTELLKDLEQLLEPLPEQEELRALLSGGTVETNPLSDKWVAFGRALTTNAEARLALGNETERGCVMKNTNRAT
jgi:hypothetical protein